MNILLPLSMYASPWRTAVVRMRCRIIGAGTNEIQRLAIARQLLQRYKI